MLHLGSFKIMVGLLFSIQTSMHISSDNLAVCRIPQISILQSIELLSFDLPICQEEYNEIPTWLLVSFSESNPDRKPVNKNSRPSPSLAGAKSVVEALVSFSMICIAQLWIDCCLYTAKL